jgi:hypothetical protein
VMNTQDSYVSVNDLGVILTNFSLLWLDFNLNALLSATLRAHCAVLSLFL